MTEDEMVGRPYPFLAFLLQITTYFKMSVADPTPNSTGSSQSCHRTLAPAQTPPASPQCMIPRFEFCRCSLLPLHSTDRCDLSTPSLGTSSWPRSVVPHPRKGLPGSGTKPRGVHGPKRGL